MSRPLLLFSVTFIIGVYGGAQLTVPLPMLMGLAGLLLVGAAITYQRDHSHTLWLLLMTCLVTGMFTVRLFDLGNTTQLTDWYDQSVTVVGKIVQEPDVRPDKVFYVVDVAIPAKGLLRLTVHNPEHIFSYGDIIEANGQLQRASEPGNPGQFDYREYLARRGIHVIMSVWQPEQVQRLGVETTGVMGWSLKAKEHFQQVLTNTLPQQHSALMQGMLFGTRGLITNEVTTAFQMTSLVHILCVSGFHVSLVLGALLLLLSLFKVPLRGQAPVCTVLIFFYAAMTGMGPAVLRAAIMGLMVVWARHFGRERDWPTAMALAGAVVLFIWPYGLWEPGFQLSFVVTGGILYFVPRLVRNVRGWYAWPVAALAVPLVAEITALPLVAYHFNMISLVGVLANVLTGPLIMALILLSGLSVLVGLLYLPLAALINISTSVLLDIMLWIVKSLATLPQAVLFVSAPPKGMVLLAYLLLFFALTRVTFTKSIVAVATLAAVLILYPTPDGKYLTAHYIDVGQGDAMLLQTPGGKNMLIDAGGWRGELETGQGAGSGVVLPYLKRQGINQLDVLMLSHPHEDHVGGVKAVMQQIPIKLTVVAPVDVNHPEVEQSYWGLLRELDSKTTVRQGWAGYSLQLDDQVQMKIISPPRGEQGLNNSSLVLMVRYQQVSLLFTGDIEKEFQQLLVTGNDNLEAQILKVPHHGSGNMAVEFYHTVNPRVAVISVGEKNKFGHPAPALLQLLEGNHTKVYRTDLHGAIVLKSDGQSIWVDTGRKSTR